jgi:hypothetical protein
VFDQTHQLIAGYRERYFHTFTVWHYAHGSEQRCEIGIRVFGLKLPQQNSRLEQLRMVAASSGDEEINCKWKSRSLVP